MQKKDNHLQWKAKCISGFLPLADWPCSQSLYSKLQTTHCIQHKYCYASGTVIHKSGQILWYVYKTTSPIRPASICCELWRGERDYNIFPQKLCKDSITQTTMYVSCQCEGTASFQVSNRIFPFQLQMSWYTHFIWYASPMGAIWPLVTFHEQNYENFCQYSTWKYLEQTSALF